MKHFLLVLSLCPFILTAQTYQLTVINGYGSGAYDAGDTVDIWSHAFPGNLYFDSWSGDTDRLQDSLDWHTRIIMPHGEVTVEALIKELPSEIIFSSEKVTGVDTLKDIWYAFPETSTLHGIVWLFHGTDGTGRNWFINTNMLTCTKRLLAAGYAVIAMDCEEKTYLTDFNLDGVFRWDYTFDSTQNIDLQNIKVIRDTLITRGLIDISTPAIAYGYSAGGAFATHIATLLQWRAGISHNSAGVPWVPDFGMTPILYSMTANDNHPEVGQPGNLQAEENAATLLSREICAEFHLARPQPLYPQRFSRDPTISLDLSEAIFEELENNQVLDDEHYLFYSGDQLTGIIISNPGAWPVILSLTPAQQLSVGDELDETFATHRFNSDLFGSDLRFITGLCDQTTSNTEIPPGQTLYVYPNPASGHLVIQNNGQPYSVIDLNGQIVLEGSNALPDISSLPSGMYFIVCGDRRCGFIKQ